MSYDHWKSTNPADEELGSQPQPGEEDEPEPIVYKGIPIEFIGGIWAPYRIQLWNEKPRFFQNLNAAKAFISWWLDDE